jgi:hypothetical protein
MVKTLVRKQLQEIFRGFFFDRSEERVDERNGESYFMNWYHRDLNGN